MQASLAVDLTGSGGKVVDELAPPDTWASKDNPDALRASLEELAEGDVEREGVENFFNESIGDHSVNFISIKRIESLSLWQSYVAKRNQLQKRARAEGLDEVAAEAYEHVWMFHGTVPDVIPKICSQGFNRSFCGRNAVRYGKGVYFATNSKYSNRYARPDSKGIKRMFLCRVAVGEYCLGKNELLVPYTRDASRNILYDSTTDSMSDKERDMFVVYHDAQAYPEYLIEYKICDL